jgi:hypothetical protein
MALGGASAGSLGAFMMKRRRKGSDHDDASDSDA